MQEVTQVSRRKAIIFDIDGTIMPQGAPFDFMPSDRLKKIVNRLKSDYFIAFASGRAKRHVLHLIEFFEFESENVISAGSEILDAKNNKITWSECIPKTALEHVSEILKVVEYQIATPQQDSKHHDFSASQLKKEFNYETTAVYVMGMLPEEAEVLASKLEHQDLSIINMHHYKSYDLRDIHITSKKASKEHAVNELLKRQGISKENTIVIGDGENDLALFNAAGFKVAMGNSAPVLKAEADLIIGDVKDDGLAEYLESLI